jgi:hypothetical protein
MTSAAGDRSAVATVSRQGFRITTAQGSGVVPIVVSFDWNKPKSTITRAIVIFHGEGRDAEDYYRTMREAADIAGHAARAVAIIAPQFLDDEDISAHGIPAYVLRWRHTEWESGASAVGPLPISSYEIVDAVLTRLADPSLFPNLKMVILAGHSGGGQLVQRYAVVGRMTSHMSQRIHIRFVVANPSSYLYFSEQRPVDGHSVSFRSDACPEFESWKYGTVDAPAYVQLDPDNTWSQMEVNYAQRDVIYLLGTSDTNPRDEDLDISCSAEAQGPTRFARGQAYYAYLHGRHPSAWNQRIWFVSGVAHSARKMFTSRCGISTLFDNGDCLNQ